MKVVVWNCNMAFRKKAQLLTAVAPDILIIPECESLERLSVSKNIINASNVLWYGDNQHKGLGVFSFGKYQLEILDVHNPEIKTIIPIKVSSKKFNFILFAVWAYNPKDPAYNYIGQVWKAVEFYSQLFREENIMIAGDFNSNVIWDKLKRRVTHSMVLEKFDELNIHSVYHYYNQQVPGEETDPTFFLYRHEDRPYHIDYCFVTSGLLKRLKSVEVGRYKEWSKHSDHKPLVVTFV